MASTQFGLDFGLESAQTRPEDEPISTEKVSVLTDTKRETTVASLKPHIEGVRALEVLGQLDANRNEMISH